jgi:hypothetical protein
MMPETYRTLQWAGVILLLAFSGGPALTGLAKHNPFPVPAALAAQATPASTVIDPAALKILKGMSNTLAHATSFTFTATTMRDETATTGQALEFYSRSSVTVTRPNKLMIRVQGDVDNESMWYDGQTLSLVHVPTKFYSQVPAPGTIDGLLDLLENKFNDPLPAASVLYADPYAWLANGLKTAFVVGEGTIDGVRVQHLAFTEEQADWQIWIQDTSRPVPTRFSVIYKNVPKVGSLRVSTTFTNWNLHAIVPASTYHFVIPIGGKRVPLKPR